GRGAADGARNRHLCSGCHGRLPRADPTPPAAAGERARPGLKRSIPALSAAVAAGGGADAVDITQFLPLDLSDCAVSHCTQEDAWTGVDVCDNNVPGGDAPGWSPSLAWRSPWLRWARRSPRREDTRRLRSSSRAVP